MDHIKYYTRNDLAVVSYLEKTVELLNTLDHKFSIKNLSELLKVYNVIKYFNDGILLDYCKTIKFENFENKIDILNNKIGMFIKSNRDRFLAKFGEVEHPYEDDFWEFIDKYNLVQFIQSAEFRKYLELEKHDLRIILRHKKLVNKFDEIIKEKMIADFLSAEVLLSVYEINDKNNSTELIIPSSLSLTDKEKILNTYINSKNPNPNYIEVIENIRNSDSLRISDKLRIRARKKKTELNKAFFKKNQGIPVGVSIKYNSEIENEFNYEFKDGIIECTVNTEWISQNKEYATLLNNFIYIFQFFDSQMRLVLVNNEKSIPIFESLMTIRSKNAFPLNSIFYKRFIFSEAVIRSYYEQLKFQNIQIENMVEWFFIKYLDAEFSLRNYKIRLPFKSIPYFDKCRIILPEIDRILKQFKLFVEDGFIDQELLCASSKSLKLRDYKSLLEKKYIYSDSEEFKIASGLIFSDQCPLRFVNKSGYNYKNFLELVHNEKIKSIDFPDYDQYRLDWLKERNLIREQEDGYLEITNIKRVLIFKDLYFNSVINYWHYEDEFRKEMDILLEAEIVRSENTFFSKPEYEYFDYHLNKSSFTNSLDIRNSYLHATQSDPENEDEHYQNYLRILKLIIIIIIKINDELCIADEIRASKK